MENVLKEALPKEVIEVQEAIVPVEPQGGFPWGGVGIGVLVVAGIAIATKVLSD